MSIKSSNQRRSMWQKDIFSNFHNVWGGYLIQIAVTAMVVLAPFIGARVAILSEDVLILFILVSPFACIGSGMAAGNYFSKKKHCVVAGVIAASPAAVLFVLFVRQLGIL